MVLNHRFEIIRIGVLIVLLGFCLGAQAEGKTDAPVAQQQDQIENVALVEARYTDNDPASVRENVGASLSLPTGLWIMGSALLAMAGYKRMRNKADPS